MKKINQTSHQILFTTGLLLFAALFAILIWFALERFFSRMAMDYFYPWNKLVLNTESVAAREALAISKSKRELAAMVDSLQQENAKLAAQTAADDAVKLENKQLRALLNLVPPANRQSVYAQIMLRDPVTWNPVRAIKFIESHGIQPGDPVVVPAENGTTAALAGRVISVSRHTATVATLRHKKCTFSVLLTESGQYGFLNGTGGMSAPVISALPVEGKYGAGEIVMTGGLSQQVPSGLFVGILSAGEDGKAVEIRNGLYAEARLKPAADTGNLRFVTILIRTATARSNSR